MNAKELREEITHQISLLDDYRKRARVLERQIARFGDAHVPPYIQVEYDEIMENMQSCERLIQGYERDLINANDTPVKTNSDNIKLNESIDINIRSSFSISLALLFLSTFLFLNSNYFGISTPILGVSFGLIGAGAMFSYISKLKKDQYRYLVNDKSNRNIITQVISLLILSGLYFWIHTYNFDALWSKIIEAILLFLASYHLFSILLNLIFEFLLRTNKDTLR